MTPSARVRPRLSLSLVIALVVVGVFAGLGTLIAGEARRELRSTGIDSARRVLVATARSSESEFNARVLRSHSLLVGRLTTLVRQNAELEKANIYVLAPDGKPVRLASSLESSSSPSTDPVEAVDIAPLQTHAVRYYVDGSKQAAEFGAPIGPHAHPLAVLGLYFNLKPLQSAINQRANRLVVISALAGCLAALIVLLFLQRMIFRPLRKLRSATRAISDGRTGTRLGWAQRGEMGSLAHDFDQMAKAVEDREHLRALSTTDALTQLANHRMFHDVLDRELERGKRYAGRFSVLILDLDGFKAINDTAGHAQGDLVLIMVAQTLKSESRPSDLVARIGGDEFAILMPESGRDAAITAAGRLTRAVGMLEPRVGISFGAAEWPADGPDKQGLLFSADMALYAAKPGHSDGRRKAVAEKLAQSASRRTADPAADQPAATTRAREERVQRVLTAAREELAMEVAFVSEFKDGNLVFRSVLGDGKAFGFEEGDAVPLANTYCQRMVRGEIPQLIPDTASDGRVNSLEGTLESGIRAYVGIPLRSTDGKLYGTLCCASHHAAPHLRERDVAFMQVLARLLTE